MVGPTWMDCTGEFSEFWDPIHNALTFYFEQSSTYARNAAWSWVGPVLGGALAHEMFQNVEFGANVEKAFAVFSSAVSGSFREFSFEKSIFSGSHLYSCFYGLFAAMVTVVLRSIDETATYLPPFHLLLARYLKMGALDFVGSTRWSFIRRIDVDEILVLSQLDVEDPQRKFEPLRFEELAVEAARHLPVARQTWGFDSRSSVNVDIAMKFCVYYEHNGAFLNAFSAVENILSAVGSAAIGSVVGFGCVQSSASACANSKCDDRYQELCDHVSICSVHERNAMHKQSWCDVAFELEDHGHEVSYAAIMRRALSDESLSACDVVVDPLGYNALLLAASAHAASLLVWQDMSIFGKIKSWQREDETIALAYRLLASHPRHVMLATTEKLVAQSAWHLGVVPVLCRPPMLHMEKYRVLDPVAKTFLVFAASAMRFLQPVLRLFQAESIGHVSYQQYRSDPVKPMRELAAFSAVIFVPYNPHAHLFMELYSLRLPLFVPDEDLMYSLQRSHPFDDHILRSADVDVLDSIPFRRRPLDALTGLPATALRGELVNSPSPFWNAENMPTAILKHQFFFVWHMSPMKTYDAVQHWTSIPQLLNLLTSTNLEAVRASMAAFQGTLVQRSLRTLEQAIQRLL